MPNSRSSSRGSQALAVVLATVLTASGCTGGHSATPAKKVSAPAAVTSSVAPIGHSAAVPQVGSVVATLASAGVATVADESSTAVQVPVTGATVLTVTRWQVSNLAAEVGSGDGISGADLNAMLPMPASSPQFDDVVGGWVLTAADPAAVAAGKLLGPVNWSRPEAVVFPTELLTLFLADALQHAGEPGPAASTSGAAWRGGGPVIENASVVTAPCSAVSGFVDSVLDRVFGILKVDAGQVGAYLSGKLGGGPLGAAVGGLFSFAAGLWNKAVDLAQQGVRALLKSVTQPVLNVLAVVIGGVAVISTIRGILKHWAAPITATPAANAFAVGSTEGNPGAFKVAIDTHAETEDWPPQLLDCASAAGVKLPTLATAGSPVTWTVEQAEPGLITPGELAGTLAGDLTQTLDYRTGHEDARLAQTGTLVSPDITVHVQVRRTEVEELRTFIAGYLTGKVPGFLAPVVNPILTSYINYATQWLDLITAIRNQSTIVVTHHVPKPTPTPTITSAPPSASAGPPGPALNICALMPATLVGSIKGRAVGDADGGALPGHYSCTYGVDDASIHAFIPAQAQVDWCSEIDNDEKTAAHRNFRTVDGLGARAEWNEGNGLVVFYGSDCLQFFNLDAKIDRDGSLTVDEGLLAALRPKLRATRMCTAAKHPAFCP
jgi:hypothetical protein